MTGAAVEVQLTEEPAAAAAAIAELVSDGVAGRLFAGDATLWGPDAEAEASIRLGWIDAFERADELLDEIDGLRASLLKRGVDRVVLCGMGGSSLAPEIIARRDWAALTVLDSTHPGTVRRVLGGDLSRTVLVVSSKSGTTVETRSHLAAFEQRFREAGIDAASRIVVVTDPGSPLEAAAQEAGYRVFPADPNVGGRFSALTAFGLVPAALAGADARALIAEARAAAPVLAVDEPGNPALRLAAALAAGLPARYACALTEAEVRPAGLGDWIEQLVAESTGKQGLGVLPLALADGAPELHGAMPAAAILVALSPEAVNLPATETSVTAVGPLGAQFLLWEAATSVLCRLMGVNPFDQPDVEAAKVAARAAMAPGAQEDRPLAVLTGEAEGTEVLATPGGATGLPEQATPDEALSALRESIPEGGYLAVQAYLDAGALRGPVAELRDRLAAALGVPVSLGWGPRFLHSTGQLHKGGPRIGAFLQLLDIPEADEPIPGLEMSFGALIAAQARGDREVLQSRGRPVLALRSPDPGALVRALIERL